MSEFHNQIISLEKSYSLGNENTFSFRLLITIISLLCLWANCLKTAYFRDIIEDMTKKEAAKRIAQLRKTINYYSYQYHVLDKLDISAAAWDSLKHELKQLEDAFPDLITPDSPTRRVSGQPLDKFIKVSHKERMLSLEDAFSPEETAAWQERIQKLVPASAKSAASNPRDKLDYFAELKIDGFAISLVYKDGLFAVGSTRGDGRTGEDVTQNLKTIESIPLKLEIRNGWPNDNIKKKVEALVKKGEIEIRGEVYMTKSAFKKVNREREKEGRPLYANPRNTAAGGIRQLDPKIAADRQLNFLAYDIVSDLGQKTHREKHQIARALGFKTDIGGYCRNLDEVIAFWERVEKKREKIPFQIDGLVVQVNSDNLFKKLGVVGKTPRGAIAFKFRPAETTTVVEDIIVQVGRTGALTPVAKLRPVKIGGVVVTRATLHNEDEIKRLDVRIGDTVLIQRAGDVIPDIVGAIKKMRTGKEKKFVMPKNCPICGGQVVRSEGEAVHRCVNKKCAVIQKRQINHFASRKAFDIDGLGPKIVAQLMNEGMISKSSDIFTLQEGDLIPLERFDQKSAKNLINAVKESRRITLSKFIYALGIRHVGEETAINLANYFSRLEKIKKAKLDDLLKVKDTGEIVAKSVREWFNDKSNQKLLADLVENGVEIEKQKTVKRKLAGKTFVLTGQLEEFTRDQVKDRIRRLGGDVSSSVSPETDFVVAGAEPGSKYDRAKKLGVKIIGEKEFKEMTR